MLFKVLCPRHPVLSMALRIRNSNIIPVEIVEMNDKELQMSEREVSHLGQPVLAVGEKSFVVLALREHFPATETIVLPTPYYYQKLLYLD